MAASLVTASDTSTPTNGIQRIQITAIHVPERLRPLGDFTALAQSIKQLGLLNPITITGTGRLIAGLHRLEACKLLGWDTIDARVVEVSETEAELLECDENLIRNDLTVLERAEHYLRRKQLYEKLHPEARHGGWRGNSHTGGISGKTTSLSFCLDAGQKTHRSARTIQRLIEVAKHLCPKAKDLLRNTEWSTNQVKLQKIAKLSPDLQVAVAEKIASRQAEELNEALSQIHQERFRRKPCHLPLEGTDYKLLCGDFREVGHEVASGSVELVLTDAPYKTSDLPLFQPMGLFAHRVLRHGGSLVCMVGHHQVPRILLDIGSVLEYRWMIVALFNGMATYIPNKYVNSSYKPILWFVKRPYHGKAIKDVIQCGPRDKRFHRHGQSVEEFAKLVRWYTKEGDMVADCFLGGGTSAVAALSQGRRFIGIDIDRKHIETTRRRIEMAVQGRP